MNILIYNISWDTDGEDANLPTEVVLELDSLDSDKIGNILSDKYGFCHFGFNAIEMQNK